MNEDNQDIEEIELEISRFCDLRLLIFSIASRLSTSEGISEITGESRRRLVWPLYL